MLSMVAAITLWSIIFLVQTLAERVTHFQLNARAAANHLMTFYNSSTGLWHHDNTPLWWNSANMLTAMIDLFNIDPPTRRRYESIILTTYNNAPIVSIVTDNSWSITNIQSKKNYRATNNNFLNDYYDDEGWWALVWLSAYDLTHDPQYLTTARYLWTDMKNSSSSACGKGGIWWDRKQTYIASIANELLLAVSFNLAIHTTGHEQETYINAATTTLHFLTSNHLLDQDHLILDGLTYDCHATGAKYTYNQGVILGALVDLSTATGNTTYLVLATSIANAVLSSHSPFLTEGILHEVNNCERRNACGLDGDQFKGIFVRNLRRLYLATDRRFPVWKQFIQRSARSIWSFDRRGIAALGPNWAGPFIDGTVVAHASASECLIAAAAVEREGEVGIGTQMVLIANGALD